MSKSGSKRKSNGHGRRREWSPYDETLKDWINDNLGDPSKRTRSKTELARYLDMPPSSISRLCGGRRRVYATDLPRIERFFGKRAPKFKHPKHHQQ